MSKQKDLKVREESATGRNVSFVNTNSGRTIPVEQAVRQIDIGNPTYSGYHVVRPVHGQPYVRSNPDGSKVNNIE